MTNTFPFPDARRGDLVEYRGGGATRPVHAGTTAQVLGWDSNGDPLAKTLTPSYSTNNYRFAVHRSAATQAISDSTSTVVQFNTEDADPNSNFDNATNYNYTAPVAGVYQVNWVVEAITLSTDVAGRTWISSLFKNGGEAIRGERKTLSANATADATIALPGSGLITLAASDTIDIRVFHTMGANRNVNPSASAVTCTFSGFMVTA